MKNKGFTILELLLVISLLLLIFGFLGYSFITNIKGFLHLSYLSKKLVTYLIINDQLTKQTYGKIIKLNENFILGKNGLSFYTVYPVFFTGAVRAEYRIVSQNGKKKLLYMEFPYIDGKLGDIGIKKMSLGIFDQVVFEVFSKGRFVENYRGENFPEIIKVKLDDYVFYIYTGEKK